MSPRPQPPAARSRRPARRGGVRRAGGVALILVISTVAILSAVAVDFQYNSGVDLQLAANARDELRAEYLARSGINLSRLLLRFQRQLDGQSGMAASVLQQLMPGGGAGLGAGLNIRLWELVPVECGLFGMLSAGRAAPAPGAAAPAFGEKGARLPGQSFGDFTGCFSAKIEDEEQKINLNRLNMGSVTGRPPMLQALALLGDPRFEFIFDKADAHGVKMTAQEVLIALHDWIDERDSQAVLNLTDTGDPFQDGFGDENKNYASRYPHHYRAKNAPFDTLDEVFQVDGVSDLFMDAFGDRLTVYPDRNTKLNINTNDPVQQVVNVYSVAANINDPKLRNPLILQAILQEIAIAKLISFLGMGTAQFVQIVERNGIAVRPDIKAAAANNWIGDKSQTFTVKSTGQAGDVQKQLTAVVRYDEGLGKLLYFRQE